MATQVLQCGGVITYQLLCGREIAAKDDFARQMANYCYLVVNTHDRTAIAIDAAWDVAGLYSIADQLGVKLRAAVYTHFHFDHCGGEVNPMFTGGKEVFLEGAKEMEERGCQVWAGNGDAEMVKKQCRLARVQAIGDGGAMDCGDMVLHFIHTPGHSPGSMCVFAAPQCLSPRAALGESPLREKLTKAESGLLFTGDTLFPGSCGRMDLPGSDPQQMFGSLARLSTLHPDVVVLPGHGYAPQPFSTVGAERLQNETMRMGLQKNPTPQMLPLCCVFQGACGPSDFVIGRKVRIDGLTSEVGRPLNGKVGVVQSYEEDKERYSVRLLGASEVKAVRPLNLTRELSQCIPCPKEPKAPKADL